MNENHFSDSESLLSSMHNKIFRIISTGKYFAGPSVYRSEQRSVRNFNFSRNKMIWSSKFSLFQICNGARVLMTAFSSDRAAEDVRSWLQSPERFSTMQGWKRQVKPIKDELLNREFASALTLASLRLQKINRTWIGSLQVSTAPTIVRIASFPFSPIAFFARSLFIHVSDHHLQNEKLTC